MRNTFITSGIFGFVEDCYQDINFKISFELDISFGRVVGWKTMMEHGYTWGMVFPRICQAYHDFVLYQVIDDNNASTSSHSLKKLKESSVHCIGIHNR